MKAKPLVALFLALGLLAGQSVAAEGPRVLIFTGQNNHNWRETTPKLKAVLEAAGRFTIDVTEHPEQCDAAMLAKYDVVVSDWNTWGKAAVTAWSDATRAALLDFIRGGKGFVAVHAGSSSFFDWPEYQRIAGAWWQLGQTSHGKPHEFTVKPVGEHPITPGFEQFGTTDELWIKPASTRRYGVGDATPPIALVTELGKGRGFTLLLGHSAAFMDTPGFQVLFTRGVEWAATGRITTGGNLKPVLHSVPASDTSVRRIIDIDAH